MRISAVCPCIESQKDLSPERIADLTHRDKKTVQAAAEQLQLQSSDFTRCSFNRYRCSWVDAHPTGPLAMACFFGAAVYVALVIRKRGATERPAAGLGSD